jgi:hypothetical protein
VDEAYGPACRAKGRGLCVWFVGEGGKSRVNIFRPREETGTLFADAAGVDKGSSDVGKGSAKFGGGGAEGNTQSAVPAFKVVVKEPVGKKQTPTVSQRGAAVKSLQKLVLLSKYAPGLEISNPPGFKGKMKVGFEGVTVAAVWNFKELKFDNVVVFSCDRHLEWQFPLGMVERSLRKADNLHDAQVLFEDDVVVAGESKRRRISSPGGASGREGTGMYYEVCYLGYGVFMGIVRASAI